MILIADSGSTKTNWFCFSEEEPGKFIQTPGINPFFRDTQDIANELRKTLLPKVSPEVTRIFFYGAGIIDASKGAIVKKALTKLFAKATVEVESDLLAAARSTLGNKRGIACILGTGCNSCLYNGVEIIEHIPPLGFILGDEGSGAVLGRKIIADYLKGIMPGELSLQFKKRFPLNYSELLENIYKKEKPNRFLSGFAPFIKDNIETDYCRELTENSFDEFVTRNLFRYSNFKEQPVCFVGSVAFFFQEQLKNVLKTYSLKSKIIVQEPLQGLINYHLQK